MKNIAENSDDPPPVPRSTGQGAVMWSSTGDDIFDGLEKVREIATWLQFEREEQEKLNTLIASVSGGQFSD